MTILSWLNTNKAHIIYGVIIVGLASIGYHFFKKEPVTVTKTQVVTKVVTQVVTKVVTQVVVKKVLVHDNIIKNRRIVTRKPDGTVTTEIDSSVNKSVIADTNKTVDKTKNITTSQTIDQTSTKVVTSYAPNYLLSVFEPIPTHDILHPNFDAKNTQIILGTRVLDTPLFFDVGTNFGANSVLLGFTLEL